MEKDKEKLNLLEQSWIASELYEKSDEIAKVGGVIDTKNISTMAKWLEDPKNEKLGIDKGKSKDERLQNKYVIPVTVTIPGSSESTTLEIIVDSNFRDVAVMARGENGDIESFKIADRIKNNIASKSDLLKGQLSADEIDMLKTELEKDLPQNVKELAEEWTREGRDKSDEDLEPSTVNELKEKTEEITNKDGKNEKKIDENKINNEKEKTEEENAKKIIPDGQEDIIEVILAQQGLKMSDIVQVNEIDNAGALTSKTGLDDSNINRDDSVIVIRVKNKALDGSPDHMVAIQGNKLINSEGKDKSLEDFVDKYGGKEGEKITTYTNEAYDTLQFKGDDGRIKNAKVYAAPEPSKEESVEFLIKFQQLEAEREAKLREKREMLEKEIDPGKRQEILKDIKYIQVGYAKEFKDLKNTYGVEMDTHENDLNERVENANEDVQAGTDHTQEGQEEQEEGRTPWGDAEKRRMQNR